MADSTSTEGLKRLVEAMARINSSVDLHELLGEIMDRSKQVMRAEASTLMLLDDDGQHLSFEVALSESGETPGETARLPIGKGIAGHVARSGQPFLTNDAYNCPLFFRDFDDASGFRSRSILCVPMFTDDRLIGVCEVINRLDGEDFTQDQVELFGLFGRICAVAIHNSRLRGERETRRRLEREMNLAREIQESFLPDTFPEAAGMNFEAYTAPASFVGGDLYDVFSLENGEVVCLIGDVSGKGASASLYGARMLSELRLLLEFCDKPEEVMSRVNDLMYSRSRRGMFITLLMMLDNPRVGKVRVFSAGHPMPLVYDVDRREFIEIPSPKNPPLGVLHGVRYQGVTVDTCLRNGVFFGFTDGMIEARNESGEEYGLERLKLALAAEASTSPPGELLTRLLSRLDAFVGGAPQHDDLTALCLRRLPSVHREVEIPSDPARHEEARQAVREFALLSGFDAKETNRIEVAVGEALSNVTRHCYQGATDRPIRVRLERAAGRLKILIEDDGPLLLSDALPDGPTPAEEPGGLGLELIRKVMDEVSFQPREKQGNSLTLVRRLPGSGGGGRKENRK